MRRARVTKHEFVQSNEWEGGEVMKRTVVAAHQSPLNAAPRLVAFDCGHAQWVTAKRRIIPGRMLVCSECRIAAIRAVKMGEEQK